MVRVIPWLLLAGCSGALPARLSAVRVDRAGTTIPSRAATACEQAALAPESREHTRAFDDDLDRDGVPERVVFGVSGITVLDRGCATTRGSFSMTAWAALTDVGPTLPSRRWPEVSAAEYDRLGTTDRVGPSAMGATMHRFVAQDGTPYFALLWTGTSPDVRMVGWQLLLVGCRAGRCVGRTFAHAEWKSVPDRAITPDAPVRCCLDETRAPMLFVRGAGSGLELELRHITYEREGDPGRVALWRTERFDVSR